MLRISKLTDYATVILVHLPDCGAGLRTAAEVASAAGLALPTVSKVLKELQRAGLVASTRGAHGGYVLARPAAQITAADIIDAVEGPFALTECASHDNQCGIGASCRVGATWQKVSLAIRGALAGVTLSQLAGRTPLSADAVRLNLSQGAPLVWRARA